MSPNRGENKKCLKPPPSYFIYIVDVSPFFLKLCIFSSYPKSYMSTVTSLLWLLRLGNDILETKISLSFCGISLHVDLGIWNSQTKKQEQVTTWSCHQSRHPTPVTVNSWSCEVNMFFFENTRPFLVVFFIKSMNDWDSQYLGSITSRNQVC